MFKVFAQHDGALKPVFICEVASLIEADAIIADLDRQWQEWEASGFPEIADPRVSQMEGSGIYAESDDGSVWIEISPGEWEKDNA